MRRWVLLASAILTLVAALAATGAFATAELQADLIGPKLKPCRDLSEVLCGSITRPLDPADPEAGTMKIGFQFYPARAGASEGTIVAVEGGPGYATTASADWYLELYEPLRDTRDILLVDNRGTGLSQPIRCRLLQNYQGDYAVAVEICGEKLGGASDLYGSAFAADDLAAVLDYLAIDRIDLYGDSYGTYFAQTFAVRHPTRVRTVTLDAAYPVEGLDPWYRDISEAIVDSFQTVCKRDPGCSGLGGDPIVRLRQLAAALAVEPLTGHAFDADGVRHRVTIDVPELGFLMGTATYGYAVYRELDAAGQAWLDNDDPAPLLRIMAEQTWWGDAGPVAEYSEALYVGTACNDYPQLWDRFAARSDREAQYQAAVDALKVSDPDAFYPFTVDEWLLSSWSSESYFCLPWPAPDRWVPPLPNQSSGGPSEYPTVPVLVMVGDLDSITSPEASLWTANHFPNSTYLEVPNVAHVVALGDYQGCTSSIAVRFVATGGDVGDVSCVASAYQEVRTVESFPKRLADVVPAEGASAHAGRVARAVLDTVGDIFPRWMTMAGESGVGLRGGKFSSTGFDIVEFDLRRLEFVNNVKVSGSVVWDRFTGVIEAEVRFEGAASGRLLFTWNDYDHVAVATASGRVDGEEVALTLLAP